MALDFNGSDMYVACGVTGMNTDDITIGCWVNVDQHRNYNGVISLGNVTGESGVNPTGRIGFRLATTNLQLMSIDLSNKFYIASLGSALSAGWHFVAGRSQTSGNVLKMQVDATSYTGAFNDNLSAPTYSAFHIGWGASTLGGKLDGKVSNVFVYNRYLSDAELQIVRESRNILTIPSGLVLACRLNEKETGATSSGSGQVIDLSPSGNHGTSSGSPVYLAHEIRTGRGTSG